MGEEEYGQQRSVRISPETKEKIKKFAKRAGLVAAGAGVGAAIGAAVQYQVSQSYIDRMLMQTEGQQCLSQYELDRGTSEAMGRLNEIHGTIIETLQGDPKRMGEALGNIAKITGSLWFNPENLGVLKKIVDDSGPDAPIALGILAALAENGNDIGGAFGEGNAAKVVEAAGLIGSLGGERAEELLGKISSSILSSRAFGPGTALRLGLAEMALKNAASVDGAIWNAELASSVAFRGGVQDIDAHMRGVFDAIGRIRGMGGESQGALEALKKIVAYQPQAYGMGQEERAQRLEDFREKAGPEGLLEAATYVVGRYADNGRMSVTLGILANVLEKGAPPAKRIDRNYAAHLCELTDRAVVESGGNGMHVLGFIEAMAANPAFDFSELDMGLAARAGKVVAGLAYRFPVEMGEVVARVKPLLGSSYSQDGRAHMLFPPGQMMDILEEFSANMPNSDRMLRNLRRAGGIVPMNAKNMDRHAASGICGLETRLYGIQHRGDSVLEALDRLEDSVFSPAVIRLVEIAVRGRQGAQSVISAIQALEREIQGGTVPYVSMLYQVGYEDVEMADEMLSSMYRTERPKLERIANFSYGISILGAEKVRELHKTFGIEYFNRYGPQVLMEVGANADRAVGAGKPILLAVAGKTDWNGAFYGFGGTDLQKLASHYKLLVAEVESDREFTIRVNQIAGMYGDISVLILGGHGEPGSISLGDYAGLGSLSFSDERRIGMLMDSFVQGPVIVLSSCSTGRYEGAIGGMLSRILGATVYAPTQNSGGQIYDLDAEGRIIGVDYGSVPTRVYEGGQSRVIGNGE